MGKTLLLADDSVTIQKVVGISFASEDIAIKTVDNGDDAIHRARELRPDIILADVVMPGKSGYEVCEAVKGDPELRHIPVLLLTGTFEAFDEDRAARAGASGHIAKPFEAQTLVERVKQLLSQPATVAAVKPSPQAARPQAAPQPAPTPAAPAAPSAPAAAAGDNAFDFFDDPTPDAGRAELEVDDAADAFAFDEDDLGTAGDLASDVGVDVPEPAAHTVAILPDDAADDVADDELALGPDPVAGGPSPSAPGGRESYDFEFESMAEGPATPSTPAAPSAGEDFAESVLLDPAGNSAYDVSSSQLGDLSVEPPAAPSASGEAPAETRLFEPPPRPETPPAEAARSAGELPPLQPSQPQTPRNAAGAPLTPPPAPNAGPMPEPHTAPPPLPRREVAPTPVREAAAPADPGVSAPDASAFVEEEATQPPFRGEDPVRFGPSDAASDPMRFGPADEASDPEPAWSAEPELAEEELPEVTPLPVEDVPSPSVSTASGSGRGSETVTDEALEQIAPALRQQIHETLEKIAWEAFGQVTETVVSQTVERLEKVAWEVVPKLAETLIAEEIRRLKDES